MDQAPLAPNRKRAFDLVSPHAILCMAFSLYLSLTLISMAAMSIGVATLAIGILLYRRSFTRPLSMMVDELTYPPIRNFFLISLFMIVTILLSLAVSYFSPIEINQQSIPLVLSDEFKKFTKLWYLFLPIIVSATLRALGPKGRETSTRTWLYASVLVSVVGFIEHFTGWPRHRIIASSPKYWHTQAFLGFHLSYASIMIFPLFALLDRFSKKIYLRNSSGLTLVSIFIGTSALFFTYSRTLWFALPIGFILWLGVRYARRILFFSMIVIGILGSVLFQAETVQKRIFERGINERVDLWSSHIEFIKARPLTGVGWRRNSELTSLYFAEKYGKAEGHLVSHAHSNILEVLAGTGIIGFIAWLTWCAFGIIASIKLIRDPKSPSDFFPAGLLAALVTFHIIGLTQVNFWEGKVIHQLMIAMGFILYWSSIRHESKR